MRTRTHFIGKNPQLTSFTSQYSKMNYMVLLVLFAVSIQVASCTSASDIVEEARRHIGSTTWSTESTYGTGRGTYKCNQFVYDVLKNVGANPPKRYHLFLWLYTPIGAGEWGNPSSFYLTGNDCYNLCSGQRRPGDVIGDGRHVGIVTRHRLTTSSTAERVVENDWGFRNNGPGRESSITACWRYTC